MGYISLVGLGVIGTPLAHLLYCYDKDNFALLADEIHADKLKKSTLYINKTVFSPKIFSNKDKLDKKIDIVFICVKNYSLEQTCKFLGDLIDCDTVIVPLQNGIYSKRYIKNIFPCNIVLDGFAQGPNTLRVPNGFVYQNAGAYCLGASTPDGIKYAEWTCKLLQTIGLDCIFDNDIEHAVWKKMMLNVAGNASTALTSIDYCMIKNSPEMQRVCRCVMNEFQRIAEKENILISQSDIEDNMNYLINYNEAKRTSMLEDVMNKRHTENEFLAGYLLRLANKHMISAPYIETLYLLIKIKEDVYMNLI